MATNFPSSLDTFTNPTATDTLDSPPHDQQHANINDAVEALQAKVGVDSSAVTSSLDYKVAQLEGRDTAGLVHISRTTIGSAVSSVTVTDAFSSNYDNYLIVYKIDAGSTTAGFLCEFGIGATITTTGYYESRLTVNASGTVSGVAQNNVAYLDLNSVITTGGGAGSFQVFRPYAVAKTGTASVGTDMRTGGGFLRLANGWQDSTTQFTSFRLSPTVGTLTGGHIDVYGYAKA